MTEARGKKVFFKKGWRNSQDPSDERMVRVVKSSSHKRDVLVGEKDVKEVAEVVHWLKDGRKVRFTIEVIEQE